MKCCPNPRMWFMPFVVAALAMLAGYIVFLLWNAILPGLIPGIGLLTFPKALGLLLLTRLLFGGFGGGRHHGKHHNWHHKFASMSEEERQKFRAEWGKRCTKPE